MYASGKVLHPISINVARKLQNEFKGELDLSFSGGADAFNIKETFLDHTETSGFSRMIRELIFSKYLDIYHLERYRHRMSMDGKPLYYFGLAGRKRSDIPDDFLEKYNLTSC